MVPKNNATFTFPVPKSSGLTPLALLWLFSFFGFGQPALALAQSPCVSGSFVSAQICSSGDDNSTFYLDGNLVGTQMYCNWNTTGCQFCQPVPLGDFTMGASVCLGVDTQNVTPVDNFSSWDLQVNCTGGLEVLSSQSGGMELDYVPTGNPSPSPLPDGSGNAWYEPTYNGGAFNSPMCTSGVTQATWAQPIFNPVTGGRIPFISNNCSGDYNSSNSTGALFWRQCNVLPTPQPTAGPPAVTVEKFFAGRLPSTYRLRARFR